ncbi:cytochrome P450 [Actinocorallia populi]|uniref:cytochrome P450 n=1 Tax=Actinocorallia populi TaxID=2079200 RepID=UPI0018E4F036|nr:cytochrome P450 [Actinocorallia populi]
MNRFEEMNFFQDPELVADPYPYYKALRDKCPVSHEPHHGVVMLSGYDEVAEVAQDAEKWSSCTSVIGPFAAFPVPLEGDDITALIEEHRDKLPMNDQLPTFDPPVHAKHRALLMKLITPKRLKENGDRLVEFADGVLDGFLADGEGEAIGELAVPFSLYVIADLLGVPEEDRDRFAAVLQGKDVSENTLGSTEGQLSHSPMEFLYKSFVGYIEDRRRNPREDVLTAMAQATFPDGSLPEVMDVVRVAANLYSAGQETTVRLISSAIQILADNPGIQKRLREQPELIGNFIEETLRTESPIKGDFRLSKVPVTVGGVDLPAGTTVMLMNGAANRDPKHFEDPDTFDLDRKNARHHIAFGRGIHTCPGAPLARAEAKVCLERLLARTTDIRVSEKAHGPAGARDFQYLPTFILRGLMNLHVEFTLAEGGA